MTVCFLRPSNCVTCNGNGNDDNEESRDEADEVDEEEDKFEDIVRESEGEREGETIKQLRRRRSGLKR